MSSDQVTKDIGEKLLQGWTLLGDICPTGCHTPLMRSRDKSQLFCCSCGTDFLKQTIRQETPVVECQSLTVDDKPVTSETQTRLPCLAGLSFAVESKIDWLAGLVQTCSNPSELSSLITVTEQLLKLQKSLSST
jgi:uncharacterized Zn finger protein (UPF0148 family)